MRAQISCWSTAAASYVAAACSKARLTSRLSSAASSRIEELQHAGGYASDIGHERRMRGVRHEREHRVR
jgi:hypothetical protein